jgi:hypothetical protein
MADTLDPKLLDKRIAARYLRTGVLDDKLYEKHLKALPDLADRAAPIEADLAPMDDVDEDEDEGDDETEAAGVEGGA